jgi:hypothetical protein
MTLISYETKLARYHEKQERRRNRPMSKHIRRAVAKKLKEQIVATSDPMVVVALANQLAKYLPKPKQPRKGRGTQTPIKANKKPGLDELVTIMEKQRKGIELTEAERSALNGGSPQVD